MSQAEDLLNSAVNSGIAAYSAYPGRDEHIVIGADRFITVPDSLKRIAVQFDHNIETVTFDCPRYWVGRDMSKMVVYANYTRYDGYKARCLCTNVTVDEDDDSIMHFDWTITRNISMITGPLSFLICVQKIDEDGNEVNHWNSEINTETYISEGMECEDDTTETLESDLVTQIFDRINAVDQSTQTLQEKPKVTTINLPASGWSGSNSLYSQTVSVPSITKNSQVELRPSPEQLQEILNAEIALMAANDKQTVTIFAIGGVPTSDYALQIVISDVNTI